MPALYFMGAGILALIGLAVLYGLASALLQFLAWWNK